MKYEINTTKKEAMSLENNLKTWRIVRDALLRSPDGKLTEEQLSQASGNHRDKFGHRIGGKGFVTYLKRLEYIIPVKGT